MAVPQPCNRFSALERAVLSAHVVTKGQIVVPKEIRERAGIDAGDELEISLENGTPAQESVRPAPPSPQDQV